MTLTLRCLGPQESSDRENIFLVSDVLQCPYCELKFSSNADLKQHLAFDHPDREIPPEET